MSRKRKTHSGSKKRFKVTSKGKVKRSHSGKSHILVNKSPKRRRRLRTSTLVKGLNAREIKKLLGK